MNSASRKSTIVTAGCLAAIGIAGLVLFLLARRPNPDLEAHLGSSPYFANSVTVKPGTSLFFTWGVTPSPRAKAIARGDAEVPGARYGDTYQQTRALMTQLSEDLREVGLSLRDVVAVRANLVAEPELDMAGWNRAFGEFFGNATNPNKPARTTIGISRLFIPDYRAEVEFIAAVPPGRGPFAEGSRFAWLYDRLHRSNTNERVRSYGRPTWALSTGKVIEAGTALYFQSAMIPDPMMPRMLQMPLRMRLFKGDVETQSKSIFHKQVAALKDAGLTPADAFFSRNILSPDPKDGGYLDFGGFNDAYHEVYDIRDNPNRLARTIMSAPGFSKQGQLVQIETYAAYPQADAAKKFAKEDGTKVPLLAFGLDEPKATAASGVAVSPEAALTFISGIIAPERGEMKEEAEGVFATAKERLDEIGADFDNVVQVRAYVVDGVVGASTFESVYLDTFSGEHKPALTILPVVALAADAKAEVEFLAATLP